MKFILRVGVILLLIACLPEHVTAQQSKVFFKPSLLEQILDSLRCHSYVRGISIEIRNLNFASGSAVVGVGSTSFLDSIASTLNKLPAIVFEIGGHTDNTGTVQSNRSISTKRAQAVRDYLVQKKGIIGHRITYKGYGQEQPLVSNTTPSGRRRNRRVVINFSGLDSTQKHVITFTDGHQLQIAFLFKDNQTGMIWIKKDETTPLEKLETGQIANIKLPNDDVLEYRSVLQKKEILMEKEVVTEAPTQISKISKEKTRNSQWAVGIYGEGLHVPEGLSRSWASIERGPGIQQGFGGGIMAGYYLRRRILIVVQGGYSQWDVERTYVGPEPEKQVQYSSEDRIRRIPVVFGLKIYPSKVIYLYLAGGGQLLERKTITKKGHPDGPASLSTTAMQPLASGAVGVEKNVGNVFLDLAVQYQFALNKNFRGITEPLSVVGLRFGVGFRIN